MPTEKLVEREAAHLMRDRFPIPTEHIPAHRALPMVGLGEFRGLDPDGALRIRIRGRESEGDFTALCASNARLEAGGAVVLAYVDGDPNRPIVIGLLQPPQTSMAGMAQELVLDAGRKIALRCGKASLVLTSAGKILLRGTHLLSHSCGVNRIKGGSVQIN